jgi:hypothetical protein
VHPVTAAAESNPETGVPESRDIPPADANDAESASSATVETDAAQVDATVTGEDATVTGEDATVTGEDAVTAGDDVAAPGEDAPVPAEDAAAGEDAAAVGVDRDSASSTAVETDVADDAPAEIENVQQDTAEADTREGDGVDSDAETPVADAPVKPIPAPGPRKIEPRRAAPGEPSGDGEAHEPWGRVDDDGTVSVREATGWRVVGQFPDGSPAEALAYFERKFADLASEVTLLEVRHRRGGASASDLRSTARTIRGKLENAAAVGDLASLEARITTLLAALEAASESEAAAAREAVDQAVKARTELVEKAEALAARDPRSVQWKQATAELNSLFDQWQSQQQNGPRLPKAAAQQLWKRFRDARATVDKHRRAFYAELDETHKVVRDRKTRLVEKAESLSSRGEDAIPAYRELLDQWKSAGRAGKKVDDALWARFKAAGDALYSARTEREAADAEASREKIEAKRALLEEAKSVADERDIAKARSLLTNIQRRWDEVGRIFPRDAERTLDDDLRKIEQALRTREETDWKNNDPETKARANDMTRQLMDSIQKLEDELEVAKKSGDARAIAKASEALEARRSWLKALGG